MGSQPLRLWVSTQPPCHCGYVGTHHWGVQSGFRCLQTNLKIKTGKFYHFQILFFAITQPKIVESAQNQSHPTHLLKIYVHTKFQLIWPSNGQENKKWSLLFTTASHVLCVDT